MLSQGSDNYLPLVRCLDKVYQNLSSQSREELCDFLAYKELPITEEGDIIAYKGVMDNYMSQRGNPNTVVVQGIVNERGQILNTVGSTIIVDRGCVDDNRENECSHGLHVGSLDYAKNWSQRTVVVKFNPKDAVSVPKNSACQKLRVCEYTVIADLEREIDTAVFTGVQDPYPDEPTDYSDTVDTIDNYVWKKCEDRSEVSVKQIQSRMKGTPLSCDEIVTIVTNLGYWVDGCGSKAVVYL